MTSRRHFLRELGITTGALPFLSGLPSFGASTVSGQKQRPGYMVSPIAFIQNPLLWLEMMSKVRPTWTIAPNFSYRLTARKFLEAKRRLGREPIPNLDLSSLVGLHNAAEPIQIDTKEIFEQAFSSYGLNLNPMLSREPLKSKSRTEGILAAASARTSCNMVSRPK